MDCEESTEGRVRLQVDQVNIQDLCSNRFVAQEGIEDLGAVLSRRREKGDR